ncbi:MAG TPA: hypothetical protein VFP54_05965 [Acidimicrobiales bacterium]|nr:hypothetical protein [Acidimicrobiales bacterium]
MTDLTDPHDQPHQTLEVEPLPGHWALLYQETASGDHGQIVLTRGETDGEVLGCWAGATDSEMGWGVPAADVLCLAAHLAHHVLNDIPPHMCE